MALEGSFRDMSLSDLLRTFHMSQKSGTLRLINGSLRGIVYVDSGEPIDALVACSARRVLLAAQDEAMLDMMTWEDTTIFVFQPNDAMRHHPRRIQHQSAWLIREGLRRRVSLPAPLPSQAVTLDTVLQMAPAPLTSEHGITLGTEEWQIMCHLSYRQTLRRVCEITGIDAETAIRIATDLLAVGMLESSHPGAKPTALPAPNMDRQSAGPLLPHHNGSSASGPGLPFQVIR
jgi:hypothetical protein